MSLMSKSIYKQVKLKKENAVIINKEYKVFEEVLEKKLTISLYSPS